jgi:hypothetical protein
MSLFEREATVILVAHLLAFMPIGALMLATRFSPVYRVSSEQLSRWWAWFALVIVATAVLEAAVTRLG